MKIWGKRFGYFNKSVLDTEFLEATQTGDSVTSRM